MKNRNLLSYSYPSLHLSYHHFDDAVMFHHYLSGFKVDVWQLSRGSFQGNILEIKNNQVQFDRHCHNRLLRVAGIATQTWVFGIPLYPLSLLFEQKYLIEDNYIVVSPPQSEFRMIQKSAYGLYILYLTEDFLAKLCQQHHLPEPRQLLGEAYCQPFVVSCSAGDLNLLRQCFRNFNGKILSLFVEKRPDFLSNLILHDFVQQLEQNLPEKLVLTLANAQNIEPKNSSLKRTSILNQAEEYMFTYLKADITIPDICQSVGVSQRTLEYIFKNYYGMTPKTYLKQLRLNHFRCALKRQVPDGLKINQVAEDWGFWHSGQLASDYYQLFGELPSQTVI